MTNNGVAKFFFSPFFSTRISGEDFGARGATVLTSLVHKSAVIATAATGRRFMSKDAFNSPAREGTRMPTSTSRSVPQATRIELRSILEALDSMDPEPFSQIITEDSQLRFGNFPASIGKPDVRAAQIAFYSGIESMSHRVIKSWDDEDSIVAQMEVTYGRRDGTTVTIPVVDVFEIRDNKVAATLVYIDLSPLHQES